MDALPRSVEGETGKGTAGKAPAKTAEALAQHEAQGNLS
jgi:hypothetical protein